MAQVIRKTDATVAGPWLLDRAALTELDEIIEEQWSRLEAYKKRQVEHGQVSDSDDSRSIILTTTSGNKIRVKSSGEAANDVQCQAHEISKIEVKLICGGIRGDMVVPTSTTQALSLVTLPEGSDAADELFVRLNKWAEQYKPDLLRQLRSVPFVLVWVLALSLVIILLTLAWLTGLVSETNTWTSEVRALLAQGVKVQDHSRVLELLLQKAADLDRWRGTLRIPNWFYVVIGTVAIVTSLLSIRARTAFEIGRGAASVRRQKRYDLFLRYAIFSFLILGVFGSTVASYVFEFLRAH